MTAVRKYRRRCSESDWRSKITSTVAQSHTTELQGNAGIVKLVDYSFPICTTLLSFN